MQWVPGSPQPFDMLFLHSSIGSSEKSARRTTPQTDHRFRSLLHLRPLTRSSSELRLRDSEPPPSLSSAFCRASSSSIMAACSASGISSMVSSELIEGDRDRTEVGVLGILEAEPKEYVGYGSFVYLFGANEGDVLRELLGLAARA